MADAPKSYNYAGDLVHGRIGLFLAELDRAADADNLPDFKGQTLLHFAVSQKSGWAVRAILRKGANPNLLTPNRKTALDIALDPSSPAPKEIVQMLKEYNAKEGADLTIAEIYAQLETKYHRILADKEPDMLLLKVLVRNHPQKEQGFVLDYMQRHSGFSPLHDAVEAGNVAAVKFWLDLGLPPDLATRGGMTAFDIEIGKESPNPEIFDVILFYRKKRAEDRRDFFESGFIDETIIDIPANATLDDLRKAQSSVAGDTLLYRIARFGNVADIADIAQKSGQRLEEGDLLRPTHAWKTVIDIAADRGQAALLLDPQLWKGRRETLQKLLNHLGPAKIGSIKADEILIEVDLLALKSSAARRGGYKL